MHILLSRSLVLAVPILSSLLAGCGGGGSDTGGSTPAAPPAAVSPPAAPAPAPASASANVTSISPGTARINRPTLFEVRGSGLDDTIDIQLAGCGNLTQAAGGSATQRVFTCTPSGEAGPHALKLTSSAGASTSVLSPDVVYQTAVAKLRPIDDGLAVLKEDGSLWIWTNDRNPSRPAFMGTMRTALGADFADLEAGGNFGLAIGKDGKLWAWGANDAGVYGIGPATGSPTPVHVGTDFVKVAAKGNNSAGGARIVGLKRDGTLWAWGARSTPIPNSPDVQYVPHQFGTGFSELAYGDAGESMAIKADGSVWQWRENLSDTPFVVSKFSDGYQSVATAYEASFGLKKNGELWAWRRMAPLRERAGGADVPVLLGQGFVSVAAGANFAVALKADGTLWAYGSGATDQFGNNPGGAGQAPVASEVRQVWARGNCTVFEKRDGTLWGTDYCELGRMWTPVPGQVHQVPQF